jgi:hypothetical protein
MTYIVDTVHYVGSFVELVTIIYNNCIRVGRGSIIIWNSGFLAEEFRSFSHSLPLNFRIVLDYSTAAAFYIIMVYQSSHYRRCVFRVAEGVGSYNQDWPKVSEEHSDIFLYSSHLCME